MTEPLVYPDATPRLGLPFLFAGQAQKELFVNEALSRLDLLVQASVVAEAAQPPADPQPGQCWLVAQGALGAWSGADGRLAGWIGGTWQFSGPVPGMAVWDSSTGQRLVFTGAWQRPSAPLLPTTGANIDSEARAALANLITALRLAGILPSA